MRIASHPRIPAMIAAVACLLVGGYQLRNSFELYEYIRAPEQKPRYPLGLSFRDMKLYGGRETTLTEHGLKRGDQLVAVDGLAARGLNEYFQPLRTKKVGDKVRLTFDRSGQKVEAEIELEGMQAAGGGRRPSSAMRNFQSRPSPKDVPKKATAETVPRRPALSKAETTLLVLSGFLTVWFCFALGFFVAFRRPRDIRAWEMLGLLLGFGQMAAGEAGMMYSWEFPLNVMGVGYLGFISTAWPGFLLWFGLDFPECRQSSKYLVWTRWPLTLLLGGMALVRAAGSAGALVDAAMFAPVNELAEAMTNWYFWVTALTIGIFFSNLGYKAAAWKDADGKRRLNLLHVGAAAGLLPIFILLLASRVSGAGSFFQWPTWTWIVPLLMLSIFPVTLAYVVVAERSMDVRVVIRQGMQYALARQGIFVLQVAVSAIVIFMALEAVTEADVKRPYQIQALAGAVLAVILLRKFADRLRLWLDRKFFRERVEAEELLARLGNEVRRIPDTPTLLETVRRQIEAALHVARVEVAIAPAALTADGFELELPLESGGRSLGWLRLGPKKSEEPFTRSDKKLLESVAAQTALALDNHRLAGEVAREVAERQFFEREIEIAREVQERLLPHRKPYAARLDYAGRCRPAQSVGGDYYEYLPLDDGKICFAVGDVSGKGIPAALVMASLQASLRGLVYGGVEHLAVLFEKLNGLLCEATTSNRFATLFLCRIDPASGLFTYTSAGHNPALVVRAQGEVEWLDVSGLALGMIAGAEYSVGGGLLAPDDVMVMYSDGITEAFGPSGEEFGEARLEKLVVERRGESAEEILEALFAEVARFADGAPQSDDTTAVILKISG